jgi:hypothetical protein
MLADAAGKPQDDHDFSSARRSAPALVWRSHSPGV